MKCFFFYEWPIHTIHNIETSQLYWEFYYIHHTHTISSASGQKQPETDKYEHELHIASYHTRHLNLSCVKENFHVFGVPCVRYAAAVYWLVMLLYCVS